MRVLSNRSVSARPERETHRSPNFSFHLLGSAVLALAGLTLVWSARASQRRRLRELDPTGLADLGITPEQAQREAEKPMWRA